MASVEPTNPENPEIVLDGFSVPRRVCGAGENETAAGIGELSFHPAASEINFPHWLEPPLKRLYMDISRSRSHHALLIHGSAGSGKRLLAEALIALLMCVSPKATARETPLACGQCDNCRQLASGNHIDLRVLGRSEKSDIIKIDDMRDFLAWLMITSRAPDCYRVGVIDSADELNASSANALLKTLEEPAAACVIVLISNSPRALPATLTSRCSLVPVKAIPTSATLEWLSSMGVEQAESRLRQSHGAPLLALSELQSGRQQKTQLMLQCFTGIVSKQAGIAVCVERLKDHAASDCLQFFSTFIADILRVQLNAEASCLYPEEISRWHALAAHLERPQWFALYDNLQQLMAIDVPGIKVQPVLETVFAAIWQTGES